MTDRLDRKRISLLIASKLLSIPSPTTPRCPEDRFVLTLQLTFLLPSFTRCAGYERHLRLRHLLASSPQRQSESCSLSYGLEIHLQLLSTSLHRNAVTFS